MHVKLQGLELHTSADKQTNRLTSDRQKQTETDKDRQKQTENRLTEKEGDGQTDGQTEVQTNTEDLR